MKKIILTFAFLNIGLVGFSQETKKKDKKEKNATVKSKNIQLCSDSKNSPLYILDGKEINSEKLEELNAKNIAEVSVLKGEKATYKYGQKGVNGVVEIYSKKK